MRGQITYRGRSLQVADYSGLLLPGGITPTDIDGAIEVHDRLYILFELKTKSAIDLAFENNRSPIPYGQRLFIERLCNRVYNSFALYPDGQQRKVYSFLVENTHPDTEDIDGKNAKVRLIYEPPQTTWRPPLREITLGEAVRYTYNQLFEGQL
jgi:hypothetical protein